MKARCKQAPGARDDCRREMHCECECTRRRYRMIPIVVAGAILALMSVKARLVRGPLPHRSLP
jgi:hypothetical protein